MASIKHVADQKAALESQATKMWEELAAELAAKIPNSLRAFADDQRWLPNPEQSKAHWRLPNFLWQMVDSTKAGSCCRNDCRKDKLKSYGFKDFDDLKAKLKELELAWDGQVRTEVDTHEGWNAEIHYYATAFEPRKDEQAT